MQETHFGVKKSQKDLSYFIWEGLFILNTAYFFANVFPSKRSAACAAMQSAKIPVC